MANIRSEWRNSPGNDGEVVHTQRRAQELLQVEKLHVHGKTKVSKDELTIMDIKIDRRHVDTQNKLDADGEYRRSLQREILLRATTAATIAPVEPWSGLDNRARSRSSALKKGIDLQKLLTGQA